LAATLYFLGDFEASGQNAMRAVQIWRSVGGEFYPEDVDSPVSGCLSYVAMSEWHLGEIASCQANMDEAISLAKELKDMHALACALHYGADLAYNERNPAEADAWRRI
jgi:hypothetical protein